MICNMPCKRCSHIAYLRMSLGRSVFWNFPSQFLSGTPCANRHHEMAQGVGSTLRHGQGIGRTQIIPAGAKSISNPDPASNHPGSVSLCRRGCISLEVLTFVFSDIPSPSASQKSEAPDATMQWPKVWAVPCAMDTAIGGRQGNPFS